MDKRPPDLLFDLLVQNIFQLIGIIQNFYDVGFDDVIDIILDKHESD